MRPVNSQVRKSSPKPASRVPAALKDPAARSPVPDEKTALAHDLKERVKELDCIYGIVRIIETPNISLEDIFQEAVDILPAAFQYPENTCARIVLENKEYRTKKYSATKWRLSAELRLRETSIGQVEVHYLEEKPTISEGPFLEEERTLVHAIAERLSRVVERMRADSVFKEKAEDLRRLATVVSDSNDAVMMHDLDGKILAWNRGAKEMYGYTEAEALGKNVREIVAEPDREAARTLIQQITEGQVVKSFELRRLTKDGRILNVWLTTTLLMDEAGKPVAIATTERDITDRKRAETALQDKVEDLRRMATVVSDSNDAVIMHDFDGKILAWNRGAKETYGYTEAEALGKNVREIVAEPDREAALTLIQQIKQGKLVKSFELRRLAKDGRVLDVWLTTTLLRDDKGQPVAIATTERDITERKRAETVLQQKLEELSRMATVVSDSNDAVIMHDFDGKILAWNRGAQDTYGYAEAEALGRNVREIVAESDREAALTLIQNIKQGEVVKSFELRRLAKDGRVLDVWLTSTLLRDEKGQPVAIATTERDITERKRAETVLQQKLEELRRMATVVSDSNDAVIMHDFDGKILAWNRGAKEMYGYTEAEAFGMNVRDIVAEPDREAALTLIQQIKQGKLVKSFELRRLAKDGRILDVWLTTTLLTDEAGHPVAIATTERDITDRKGAENKMRQQAALLDLANDAILVRNMASEIVFWSRGAEQTYGWTKAEASDQVTHTLLSTVFPLAREALHKTLLTESQWEGELTHTRRDGTHVVVASSQVLQRDDRGQPIGILEINRDITERKRAEEEIRELNTGLERRVAERTTQLEAANKELEAFSYSVSHDLRAPLRSIDGFSQVLLEDYADKIDAAGHDALKRVRAAAQRMAQLIDDMLKLSRVTRSEMRLETVGLSAMAHAILDELQVTQPDRQVDCVVAQGIVARGDTQLLRAVLENLLGNAWKFTGKQGYARIEFGMSQRDGETAYFVRDNGAGFDMAFVDKLFGAFQRLHTAEEFPGTGIGLATVQRIIRRHGGRVWAEGVLSQGATFYFTLSKEAT